MSKVTITIESLPETPDKVMLQIDADPPFAKGQVLLTHTLGISALIRAKLKLLELNPGIRVSSDTIVKSDGSAIDHTEWGRAFNKKLAKIAKKKWYEFWK